MKRRPTSPMLSHTTPAQLDSLIVGTRAHTVRLNGQPRKYSSTEKRQREPWKKWRRAIIFDMETLVDECQASLFGVAKLANISWDDSGANFQCWEEILI